MKKNVILGAVAVLLLLVAGYLLFGEYLFSAAPGKSDPNAAAVGGNVAPEDQVVAPDPVSPRPRGSGKKPAGMN